MDAVITSAAQALAAGDTLRALAGVALRDDAPALALRGIVMARLGEYERARTLLKAAHDGFSPRDTLARARCELALAEISLVCRDLSLSGPALEAAGERLEQHGDRLNAAWARILTARLYLLIGQVSRAQALVGTLTERAEIPALEVSRCLVLAGIAIRRMEPDAADAALRQAAMAADISSVPTLVIETDMARRALEAPVGVARTPESEVPVNLNEVQALLTSDQLVVDAFRNTVSQSGRQASLLTRPTLFALARALAETAPLAADRSVLIWKAFGSKQKDASHRARLRVEIGRLRQSLSSIADIVATPDGYALRPRTPSGVVVITPSQAESHGKMLALLADGAAWTSSALSLALSQSARTTQRALSELRRQGKINPVGTGARTRWVISSVPGFPTNLFLPPQI